MVELAVEKVVGAGDHDHGNVLWTGPVEDGGQGNRVVQFAVDQNAVGGNVGHGPFAGRAADQRQALDGRAGGGQAFLQFRLHEGAERETGQGHGQARIQAAHVFIQQLHVVRLAHAMVMHAFGGAHAAEVDARHHVAEGDKRARQGLRDLVIHRAAVQRVRMGNEGDAARGVCREIEQAFHAARMAGEGKFFRISVHDAHTGGILLNWH